MKRKKGFFLWHIVSGISVRGHMDPGWHSTSWGSTWWGIIAHAMKFRKQKDREGRTRLSNNLSEATPPKTNSLSPDHLLKFPAPPTG